MIEQFLSLKGLRLLVVDNNCDSREILTLTFNMEGAEVIAVSSVKEGLEVMAACKPNILLSEVILPKEDGYSLVKRIRSLKPEQGSRIPAIAVTVAAGEADRTRALTAGFNAHVSKPVDLDKLVEIVVMLAGRNYLCTSGVGLNLTNNIRFGKSRELYHCDGTK